MALNYNLRKADPIEDEAHPEEAVVDISDRIDPKGNVVVVDLPGGSVNINLAPLLPSNQDDEDSGHEENLANKIDETELFRVSDNLLRLIEDDLRLQEPRLQDIQKGIDLLGLKLEEPRAEPTAEGMSVVRHPLLLEAVLRFQANARGEMLPADGPVKTRNDGGDTAVNDDIANALQEDFNHYLTVGAPEYYPDTDRMFFSLGFGGEAYKKVYWHPIKRRPVSETIDRKDLILSNGAVSLEACQRVTHRSSMKPSDVKRMQLVGAWRNCPLTLSSMPDENPVDEKLADVAGFEIRTTMEPEQANREIYECYCELDLRGYEHKESGEETGLPLPYRVTIDKTSRQVLEIRRWWEDGDDTYTRKEVFVEYIFVPAFDGLNIGLLHILGNASRALTAAWRIALDNGMLANFPGGIMARASGKQQTTNIRVSPGTVAPMDVDGVPLKDAFMPLPYRDVTPGFLGVVQNVEQTSQRVGGTAETATGEGRSDAPVGTTIALIEQATKVLNAVHKRMHTAQCKEFGLLKGLFRKDPECLWRGNKNHKLQDKQEVIAALNDSDIVPVADPNTASQTLRIQKAIAIRTLAQTNPTMYDMQAVDRRVLEMVGIDDIDELMAKAPPQGPGVDPAKMVDSQAKMISAQAKLQDVGIKAKTAEQDAQLRLVEAQTKRQDTQRAVMDSVADNANRSQDRNAKLEIERMKLQEAQLRNREAPMGLGAARADGGRVGETISPQAFMEGMRVLSDAIANLHGVETEIVRGPDNRVLGVRRKQYQPPAVQEAAPEDQSQRITFGE
jgi:hypothetical protein